MASPRSSRKSSRDCCEAKKPAPDPEQKLNEALREYETLYCKRVSNVLAQDAETAKKLVSQARDFRHEQSPRLCDLPAGA